MITMKFGGTSVQDADAISNVVTIVRKALPRRPVVIISAIAQATNTLEKIGKTGNSFGQAARNRGASFGVTHFFPPAFVSKYMGAEALPFDYQTRSYFFGGPWNLMTDLPAQDALMLAGAIGAYKELRELIRDGRVVHLVAPSFSGSGPNRYQISWDAIQAVESGMNRAVLLIGRGLAGPGAYNVRPQGLNPAKVYALAASSGANYGSRSGADLMANGIDVSLPERAHETIVLA